MQKSPKEVVSWVQKIFKKIMAAQKAKEIIDLENNLPDKYQCRKREVVTHNQFGLIDKYKSWLRNDIHADLKKEENYTYHIDKLLFGVGKMIKYRNSKNKLNSGEYINVTD